MKVYFSIDLFGVYSKPLNPSLSPMHKFNEIQNGARNCKMEYWTHVTFGERQDC